MLYHERRGQDSPDLARIACLDKLDTEDKETIHVLELRIVDRVKEREELQSKVAELGLAASIAGP